MTRIRSTLWLGVLALVLLLAPSAGAATETRTFRVPVEVKGFEVKVASDFAIEEPNVDGFITAMKVDVVDADGSPVPIDRLMLHHVVFAALGRRNPTCETFTAFDDRTRLPGQAEVFYGAGEERNVLGFPPGYGYPIRAGEQWTMFWMLMNHRKETDSAFVEYTVTYETGTDLTPVKPYWMDIENCRADPVYDVPGGGGRGSTHTRTYTYTMPEDGRIVAAGGHVHGGAKNLTLSQPDCGDRRLFTSEPAWGTRDHPFYNVRPILHEPGPVSMSAFLSSTGFPVERGQRIRLTSTYDNERLHTRVMGISVFYLAPQEVDDGCGPLPGDVLTVQPAALRGEPHRTRAPRFRVPLTGIDSNGDARTIRRPPGRTVDLGRRGTIQASDYLFRHANVSVDRGASLRWLFGGSTLHNVTVANGPRGFSSKNLSDRRRFRQRLDTPGTYQYFCGLHPVDMTGTITVRRRRG